jgi:hypothetical protein
VTRWFERLPIHRKLVASALLITAVALAVAMIGLSAFDIWRYRATATEDAGALASVLAENTAAAVMFNQADAAGECTRARRRHARVRLPAEWSAIRWFCSGCGHLSAARSRSRCVERCVW